MFRSLLEELVLYWFAFSTDGDAGLSVEFLGRGLVEQHVRRETGGSRVVGAIRFVRTIYMVVSRAGAEPSMLVLALRLSLVRRVAEWDAACVDVQGSGPMFQQVVRERAVHGLRARQMGSCAGFSWLYQPDHAFDSGVAGALTSASVTGVPPFEVLFPQPFLFE